MPKKRNVLRYFIWTRLNGGIKDPYFTEITREREIRSCDAIVNRNWISRCKGFYLRISLWDSADLFQNNTVIAIG